MLFRLYSTHCKSIDLWFTSFSRHYATAFNKSRRKEQIIDDDAKSQKGEVPIITCKRKSFNFYKGQTYSKKETILLTSKGWTHRKSRSDYFFIHPYDNDNKTEANEQFHFGSFHDFNLNSSVCDRLEDLNIKEPLEIQRLGIPKIINGRNTVLAAETGCGKTMAYLLPMVSQILQWKRIIQRDVNCPLGLIVVPTRELAVQIGLELIKLSKPLGIRTKIITGGKTKRMMMNPTVSEVDVIVGSFGVISKLTTVGIYKLNFVRFVVLDEADALFHDTFEEQLQVFMRRLCIGYTQERNENGFPKTAQLILASATIPSGVQRVLGGIVNVDSLENVTTEKLHRILVEQKFMRMGPSDKPAELLKYIKPKVSNKQRVIVFSNTNATSYWLSLFLNDCGVETANLNGTMPLNVRRGKYGSFLNGKSLVLSTTDAGSRGLDTLLVNHILNYDFPLETASYIHRCGRTGRIGTIGHCRVTNFICRGAEIGLVQKIEMAVRKMKPIPIINVAWLNEKEMADAEADETDEYQNEIIENIENVEDVPF